VTTNYYRVLGVHSNATPEEIKSAYRAKSRATHPDQGGSAAAFEEVKGAYQVLRDVDKRFKRGSCAIDGEVMTCIRDRSPTAPDSLP